ncbi:hypothetical protein C359_02157 [Cryptococcus neoformans Bt120]|nr:hypothetical protein C359_02157 [Cryptococcus neoformans var. grubii Bt120]
MSSPNISPKGTSSTKKKQARSAISTLGSTIALPLNTLTSLLTLQNAEDSKPRLSKISWLPDIVAYKSSILPIVLGPVLTVTLFSAVVAAASLWWGKEVGLTNNVVPLLSVVVGLLLVFRNSSAYERYAEGRKDFTCLISTARNLSRNIWVAVTLPSPSDGAVEIQISRGNLTEEKKKVIRLVVAFVVATKHHLRGEGGVQHNDLKGLLPAIMINSKSWRPSFAPPSFASMQHLSSSPNAYGDQQIDQEASLGLVSSSPTVPSGQPRSSNRWRTVNESSSHGGISAALENRPCVGSGLKRRPTAIRIIMADHDANGKSSGLLSNNREENGKVDERTPMIKTLVKSGPLKSLGAPEGAEIGLGKMVELGLPLIIAHEISRSISKFRRTGCLETVGPAGLNSLQAAVSSMTDQLGSMERIVQTPLPYVFCVHLKQVVSLYLFILPFTLVDAMGWKMVFIMFCISMTFMGVEGIAAMIEQPFGTDPSDLNLDLYCIELLCECE